MRNTDVIVWQKVLSNFSLECIRARFSNSDEVPPLNPEGFRRISNPLNWPIISNKGIQPRIEPDATPLYLDIPDYLHSVQTLQFLGFQRANAEEIFADFNSLAHENGDIQLGLADLAKEYLNAAEAVAENFARIEGQPMDDVTKVVTLTQDYMGLDLEGDRLEIIDQPDRAIVSSTVKDWVIEALQRRYGFLCKLDSAIIGMEMTYRRLEEDEAIRKARNRKKAEAKRAVKQKRKALNVGGEEEGRAEGDDQGGLPGQVQFAKDAEEKGGGAQASKNSKGAENSPKIWTL